MAPLRGLVQLPRIAQQDQVLGGMRNGEYVGERHLRGLVDEEDVHSVLSLFACPKPGGAAGDLMPRPQRLEQLLVVARKGQMRLIVLRVVGLLDASDVDACLLRSLGDLVEESTDDLVTRGRDADSCAGFHERTDHACADVSLAGSRRPLNWQDASLQFRRNPPRSAEHGFSGSPERLSLK